MPFSKNRAVVNSLKQIRDKAQQLTSKVKHPTEDMVFAVRHAIEDLDTATFKQWYETLNPVKRARLDKVMDHINQRIQTKARQRTDARIATAGRLPDQLPAPEYDLIYQEELDELKNSLKKGALEGALGIALASVGINIWF